MMYENFLGNKTAWKILRILAEAPGRGTTRKEIKEITRAGNFALSNSLRELERHNILLKKKIGKKEIYWLNSANLIAQKIMELFEMERIKLKNLQPSKTIFLAKVVDEIDKFNPKSVILFGSYAKGIATEESDFDLCVIVEKNKKDYLIKLSKLPENVQVHIFEEGEFEELKKKRDTLVEEIIRDGIQIL
jgi:predicted nucleotidyltransferase